MRGNNKHGGHGTLTYARWKSMMQRCNDPKHINYARYGGRGIAVCEHWQSFSNFLNDMGECHNSNMTIDRIKNEVGYEPGNCRWITKEEQSRNRTNCVLLTFNGVTQNVTDWAAAVGIPANSLHARLYLGWSTERALTQPLKKRGANQ